MKYGIRLGSILVALALSFQMTAVSVFAQDTTTTESTAESTTESVLEETSTVESTVESTAENTDTVSPEETTSEVTESAEESTEEQPEESEESEEEVVEDTSYDRYISLGVDLTDSERAAVLNLLGVTEAELEQDYIVNYVTNDDEYAYLSDYLSASVIGSRALSSVKVVKTEEGSGITVSTHNISYCTSNMYTNALVTAGITDADVVVAGPFSISGTSALVGVMQAYEKMTGETLPDDNKDAAVNELVLTGELSESIGDTEAAANLIADLKQKVASGDIETDQEILDAIDQTASSLDITLTEDQKNQILDLLKKFASLDLDVNQLLDQAQGIYNKLEEMGIDTQSIFDMIVSFFQNILDWFRSNSGN
jgi:uncharacterized protein YpuA (DUF1002 family)